MKCGAAGMPTRAALAREAEAINAAFTEIEGPTPATAPAAAPGARGGVRGAGVSATWRAVWLLRHGGARQPWQRQQDASRAGGLDQYLVAGWQQVERARQVFMTRARGPIGNR